MMQGTILGSGQQRQFFWDPFVTCPSPKPWGSPETQALSSITRKPRSFKPPTRKPKTPNTLAMTLSPQPLSRRSHYSGNPNQSLA